MNKKNIYFTIILLVLIATASSIALFKTKRIASANRNIDKNPDFFMTNAVYTKFDSNGNISNQFTTEKITHYSSNNIFFFDKPHMKMHNANEPPWNITANKGKSERGKSKIYIWDNVTITQASGINNSNFDITTTEFTVYPDRKYAETKAPIAIVQSGTTAKAVGAQADFKTGVVKLISNVVGTIASDQPE